MPSANSSAGTIPACAGEPNDARLHKKLEGDYPRVCGGTKCRQIPTKVLQGLSPRVRGNPKQAISAGRGFRTIPACAGEPSSCLLARCRSRDYPRVCGGTRHHARRLHRGSGLSPRVRGNHGPSTSVAVPPGTIPACAGEPHRVPFVVPEGGDYPRVCGGTSGRPGMLASMSGLSPRVRGNPRGGLRRLCRQGTIPACAGEPTAGSAGIRWLRDYPRVCGGTSVRPASSITDAGLSPRVRGNRSPMP